MSKQTYIIQPEPHPARRRAMQAVADAAVGKCIVISDPTRTLEQNAAQWPYLAGFAAQKQLCLNGEMQFVTDEDWKGVLTGCWKGEMRMAVFDGRIIMLPQRTSKMDKPVFSTWMMRPSCANQRSFATRPKGDQSSKMESNKGMGGA